MCVCISTILLPRLPTMKKSTQNAWLALIFQSIALFIHFVYFSHVFAQISCISNTHIYAPIHIQTNHRFHTRESFGLEISVLIALKLQKYSLIFIRLTLLLLCRRVHTFMWKLFACLRWEREMGRLREEKYMIAMNRHRNRERDRVSETDQVNGKMNIRK